MESGRLSTMQKKLGSMLFGLLTIVLFSSQIQAEVTGVTATVSPSRVALGRTSPVVANWRVEVSALAAGDRVISTQGTFRNTFGGNVMLGSVSKQSSKNVGNAAAGTFFTTVSEVVSVPASVIYKAQKLGLSSFVYVRTFYDIENPSDKEDAFITLTITGGGAAGFGINRQETQFDDGSAVRRLLRNEPLHAVARLSYSGSGMLKGVWELATPATTYGEPVYRRLDNIRQFLGASGQATLQSPLLDTEQPGLYLVRFRVEEPVTGFSNYAIEYYVAQEAAAIVPMPPITLILTTPLHNAFLHTDTRFSWQAVPDAQAYQLEVFRQPAADRFPEGVAGAGTFESDKHPTTLTEEPVAGALVPASQTQLALSAITQDHLDSAQSYWWRVLAIGREGKVVSQSLVRTVRLP